MIKGFILSAGLGERLRPITSQIPKPMLPILGRPIIDYAIEKLLSIEGIRLGFNLHYKSNIISSWLMSHKNHNLFEMFYEPTILGTGGALKNAEDFLKGSELFITYNGDVYSDFDISLLIKSHNSGQFIATLTVVDHPSINTLCIDEGGFLKGISKIGKRTFTGIAIYSPKILDFIPNGNSSVVDAWARAMESGHKINTFDITNFYWSDIGTIESYTKTIFDLLKAQGEDVYISLTFKDCKKVFYEGILVIEDNSSFKEEVKTKDVIFLPNTIINKPMDINNVLFGNGISFNINKDSDNNPIGSGGSERSFYRIKHDKTSVIKMQCKPTDSDFDRHIAYTTFFSKHSIPVPRLINIDRENKSAIFEDLGQLSLYNWMKCKRENQIIFKTYEKIIDVVIRLHSIDFIRDNDTPLFRDFDYEYFKWETDYFSEQFLRGYLRLEFDNKKLEEELSNLAKTASRLKKTIIHRDLQSQNIMITKRGQIALIDYQGARLGPPAYDLASLLYDPYVKLEELLKGQLWDYYASKIRDVIGLSLEELNQSLIICKLQRLMQVLGAYSFLSQVRGKRYFLKHIPSGLALLKEAVYESRQTLSYLYTVIFEVKG